MANYYKQCDCGTYSDEVPCPSCQIKELRAALAAAQQTIRDKDAEIKRGKEAHLAYYKSVGEVYAKYQQTIRDMEAKSRQDALDGQAALDEANNRIAEQQGEVERLEREVDRLNQELNTPVCLFRQLHPLPLKSLAIKYADKCIEKVEAETTNARLTARVGVLEGALQQHRVWLQRSIGRERDTDDIMDEIDSLDAALSGADVPNYREALALYNEFCTKLFFEIEAYQNGGSAEDVVKGIVHWAKEYDAKFQEQNLPMGHVIHAAALGADVGGGE